MIPESDMTAATGAALLDELTAIVAWVDEEGRLLKLESPAQKFMVWRLPDGKEPEKTDPASGVAVSVTTVPWK